VSNKSSPKSRGIRQLTSQAALNNQAWDPVPIAKTLRIELDFKELERNGKLRLSSEQRGDVNFLATLLVASAQRPGPFMFGKGEAERNQRRLDATHFKRTAAKVQKVKEGIDDLISAPSVIEALGKIYEVINQVPLQTIGNTLIEYARSPTEGFGRQMADLLRAQTALNTIAHYAKMASLAVVGRGTGKGPKGYPLLKQVMQELHDLYEVVGKGKGVYFDAFQECYKGPFLDFAYSFLNRLKSHFRPDSASFLPPWISSSKLDKDSLGSYLVKQVL